LDMVMKNKKLTYLLGFVVLIVWGMIIYRIFDASNGNDDDNLPVTAAKPVKEAFNDFSIPEDTTRLLLNYRDPFGLIKQKDTAMVVVRSRSLKTILPLNKPVFNWIFIKYSGYILNPDSKKLVALVSINGQNVMLAEGETKNQVKLIRNLKDSIKVSFNGKIKFIPIKQAVL
jgi:hypothetical protein